VSEGVYVSEEHRARKRRRIIAVVTAFGVVLGASSYVGTSLIVSRNDSVTGDTGALAPIVSHEPGTPPAPSGESASPPGPMPGLGPATKSAVRQSSLPSPTPSASAMTDEEMASRQVSRLIEPRPIGSGMGIAAERAADRAAVNVHNEVTPEGANVRVVSARYDLSERRNLLWAADAGKPIGAVRCTKNFKTDDESMALIRPGLMMCWRMSAAKSVIAIATGRPQEIYGAAVVDREWASLG
jgi:hypothetical protein